VLLAFSAGRGGVARKVINTPITFSAFSD